MGSGKLLRGWKLGTRGVGSLGLARRPSRKPANSSAIDVAPGSTWPIVRGPRFRRGRNGPVVRWSSPRRAGLRRRQMEQGAGPPPAAAIWPSASTAGTRASSIVLSPTCAGVCSRSFARPAAKAAAKAGPSSDSHVPAASDMPRKNEPSNGLAEPPSTDITPQPTCSKSKPAASDSFFPAASRIASATRPIVTPWSPSPVAASSRERSSQFSFTRAAPHEECWRVEWRSNWASLLAFAR